MRRTTKVCLTFFLVFPDVALAESQQTNTKATVITQVPASEEGKNDDKKGLTPEEIIGSIRPNLNQIRLCYETELKKSPNLDGKISVIIVINGKNGKTKSLTFDPNKTSIKRKNMLKCVKSTISSWKWPVPRGGEDVTVNYPFVFNPI